MERAVRNEIVRLRRTPSLLSHISIYVEGIG